MATFEKAGSYDTFAQAGIIDPDYVTVGNRTDLNNAAAPTVSINGSIASLNDVDVYRFEILPDDGGSATVTFDIDYAGSANNTGLDSQIQLFDGSGAFIQDNDDSSAIDQGSLSIRDSSMTFTTSAGGFYYVSVTSFNNDWRGGGSSSGNSTGSYTLHIGMSGNQGVQTYGDGTYGADALYGDSNGDVINDTIHGYAGDDVISGDAGIDFLVGGDGADVVSGGVGNDTLFGDDNLRANPTNGVVGLPFEGPGDGDTIYGGDGFDRLYGGRGDDILIGGADGDQLQGDGGADTASYETAAAGVDAYLDQAGANLGEAAGDSYDSIENLTGSAFDDTLLGDFQANTIIGGEGNDTMLGGGIRFDPAGSGNDILMGGVGNDTLATGFGTDSDSLYGGTGDDSLYDDGGFGGDAFDGGDGADLVSYANAQIAGGVIADLVFGGLAEAADDTYVGIENLQGSDFGDVLRGDAGANSLDGRGNIDILEGRGGADTLDGGDGIDLASYESAASGLTVDLANPGANTGEAAIDVLVSIEGVIGSGFADSLLGDGGDNILRGLAGDDTLVGRGGSDQLDGGAGSDRASYLYAAAGVTADLLAPGANTGEAAGDSYASIEVLEGSGFDDNLSGDTLANALFGGAGNDTMAGGAGNDTTTGGAGNDIAFVDSAGDRVIEAAGGGSDTVYASVSYALAAGQEIETLSANDPELAVAINLTGNAFGQAIVGNAGANAIAGGAGADAMQGLGGNDSYRVDNAADTVIEAAGGGSDRVRASVNYALAAGAEVEFLTTTDIAGTASIKLTGNAFGQTVIGNAGANRINGGAGADALDGRGGADTFFFNTALGASNIDKILGYGVADDTMRLENAVFTGLANGALSSDAFHIGAAAADASDRIIYDSAMGRLLFDQDGLGGNAAIPFASLSAGLAMTNADFFVV